MISYVNEKYPDLDFMYETEVGTNNNIQVGHYFNVLNSRSNVTGAGVAVTPHEFNNKWKLYTVTQEFDTSGYGRWDYENGDDEFTFY